jgi:transcriptional regulator with XRE-family HTH domain
MRETVAPVQSFGDFIRVKRMALNLTQNEVATRVGTTQGYISKVEKGLKEPTITLALKICDELNLNINDYASEFI